MFSSAATFRSVSAGAWDRGIRETMMLGKTSLDQAVLPRDAASQRNIRFLWTGFGFSGLMLVGVPACVLLPTASHASAKASLDAPALFIPTSLRTIVSSAAAKTESEVVRAG